ncbi:MAG: hypothetical protein PARBB_03760 [Parabacteroides distasonis]
MGTTDYCFSFFRCPIQNIEPIRAVGIVDVYAMSSGIMRNRKLSLCGLCYLLPNPKDTKPPISTIVLFRDYSVNGMKRN